jgi:hypothetical protein
MDQAGIPEGQEQPPRQIGAAPIVVAVVAATEWIQAHLSLYGWALELTDPERGPLRGEDRLRTRPHGSGSDAKVLVAGSPDAAAVYVGLWITLLAALTASVPRLQANEALALTFSGFCVTVSGARFVDLFSYQAGILIDPRQRQLRGAERSLILLTLNVVELTLIGTIWLYAGGFESQGHLLSRGDTVLQSVNVVGFLTPIASASAPLVIAQVASHVAAVLLIVTSIGVLLGLISASFKPSEPDEQELGPA